MFFYICLDKSSVAQWKGIKKLISVILTFISSLAFPNPSVFRFANCFAWFGLAQSLHFSTAWTQEITLLLAATALLPNFPPHLWSVSCLFTFLKEWKSTHPGDFLLSCGVWIFNWNVSLSQQSFNSLLTFLLADRSWGMTTFPFCSSPPMK